MRAHALVAVAIAVAVTPLVARAQHDANRAPATTARAPSEASQYDFLIGQWELTVKPKVSSLAARIHGQPKLRGSWKAWRALDGWGIEDELRIIDESGNPRSLTHFIRVYDPASKRWQVASVDAYRQKIVQSTAQWDGQAMTSISQAVDGDGKAYLSRLRLTRVTPTSFRYQQDRSYDGGKSWDEEQLVIEGRRVAAAAAR